MKPFSVTSAYLLTSSLIILACCTGYKHSKHKPTSKFPGSHSNLTAKPFNEEGNLMIFRYDGYQDSKVYEYQFEAIDCAKKGKINNQFSDLPIPNMIQFDEYKYVDQTEVTNLNWAEFLSSIKRDSSESLYQKLHPNINHLPTHDYFSNPFYRYYPVVGITMEQVEIFNQWRTHMITEYIGKKSNFRENISIEIRLPTEKEFIKYASCGLDEEIYPYGLNPSGYIKINPNANEYLKEKNHSTLSKTQITNRIEKHNSLLPEVPIVNVLSELDLLNDKTPDYVYELPANCCKLYGTIGNVAEMIKSDMKEAKGGSYLDKLEACKISESKTIKLPAKNVGFRSVCIIKM